MMESLRAVPSVPLLEAAPEQYLLFGLTNGQSSAIGQSSEPRPQGSATVTIEEEPSVSEKETIDGVVRGLVESVEVPKEPPAIEALAPAPESQTPAAAQPPIALVANGAKPNPFLARVAQIAELRIPVRTPAVPASLVQPDSLPAADPPGPSVSAKSEPVTPPVPQVKFAELAIPPAPPLKTAPRLPAAKLKPAAPTDKTASDVAQPAPFRSRRVHIISHQPACSKRSPAFGSLVLLAAPCARSIAFSNLRTAEPGPFNAGRVVAPKLKRASEPFCAAAGLMEQSVAVTKALELEAQSLLDEIKSRLDAVESKIQAIVAAFQLQPKLALLAAPGVIVTAPAPPDFEWMKMARPKIAAHKPNDRKSDAAIAPPQKPPLAGPCLTPDLENYREPSQSERAGKKNGIGLPAWIVSLVIATSLFLAIGVGMQYLSTNREAKAASAPAAPSAPAAAPVTPAFEQHPFARFVEVTGLRVVADTNHRSQVQYIVVNHSATQLSGMTIQIAVRSSVDPASSKPLFTVSTVVPSLGPHQSKEIRTDLDSELRNTAIPDWEYLRTEVHVGTQN